MKTVLDRKVKESIFEEMSFETSKWKESEPFEYLEEEFSVCLKSKEVQRPWGRNVLGMFQKQQEGQFGRNWRGREWLEIKQRLLKGLRASFLKDARKGPKKYWDLGSRYVLSGGYSILPHSLTFTFFPLLPMLSSQISLIFSIRGIFHFLRTYLPPQGGWSPSSIECCTSSAASGLSWMWTQNQPVLAPADSAAWGGWALVPW